MVEVQIIWVLYSTLLRLEIASDTSEHSVRLGLKLFIVSENCPGIHDNKKVWKNVGTSLAKPLRLACAMKHMTEKLGISDQWRYLFC